MYKLLNALVLLFLLSLLSCKSEEELVQKESLNISYAVTKLEGFYPSASVKVFPNPFLHQVFINISNPNGSKVTLTITDERGRFKRISEENLSKGTVKLNFEKAEAGIYLTEIVIDEEVERITLFKTAN